MKPVDFAYVRPSTIAEVLQLLAANSGAKVLAGGQTLGPMLNLRLAQPSMLIDITRIPDLVRVEEGPDRLVFGACITHAAIEDGLVPDPGHDVLARVARGIAYRAVRTRGTIGGSIAHADPAADWLSLLVALGADVVMAGPAGQRTQPLGTFVTGPMMTRLGANELLTALSIPRLPAKTRIGYHKICRKTGEFAEAIGVAMHDADRGTLRLVAGATGGAPIAIEDVKLPASMSMANTRTVFSAEIRSRLQAAGVEGLYELNIHTAALQRAIDEALLP